MVFTGNRVRVRVRIRSKEHYGLVIQTLSNENQIVGVASTCGQTYQPQKGQKSEIQNLEPGKVVRNG